MFETVGVYAQSQSAGTRACRAAAWQRARTQGAETPAGQMQQLRTPTAPGREDTSQAGSHSKRTRETVRDRLSITAIHRCIRRVIAAILSSFSALGRSLQGSTGAAADSTRQRVRHEGRQHANVKSSGWSLEKTENVRREPPVAAISKQLLI